MNVFKTTLIDRKAVWIALSDLFLDADVSLSYSYIIQVCADSPYAIEELENILYQEVAPVVSINLLSISGQWSGFDPDWLFKAINTHLVENHSFIYRIKNWFSHLFHKNYIDSQWQKLKPEILKLRAQNNPSELG